MIESAGYRQTRPTPCSTEHPSVSERPGLRGMMRTAEPNVRIHSSPAQSQLRTSKDDRRHRVGSWSGACRICNVDRGLQKTRKRSSGPIGPKTCGNTCRPLCQVYVLGTRNVARSEGPIRFSKRINGRVSATWEVETKTLDGEDQPNGVQVKATCCAARLRGGGRQSSTQTDHSCGIVCWLPSGLRPKLRAAFGFCRSQHARHPRQLTRIGADLMANTWRLVVAQRF
jgi:hypothetical protein